MAVFTRLVLALIVTAISVWAVCLDCPTAHQCCTQSTDCGAINDCPDQDSRPATELPVSPALSEAPVAIALGTAVTTNAVQTLAQIADTSPPLLFSLRI